MKKGGGGGGGSKTKSVDLGELAAHRKFNSFIEHPYEAGEFIPFFDFRSNKGQTEYIVEGSDDAEYLIINWYDDVANLGDGNDVAIGALGNDTINGEGGDDHLFGDTSWGISAYHGDNDELNGGADDDYIVGDAPALVNGATGGSDTLAGGAGNDTLWGDGQLDDTSEGGADLFVYDGGHDVIMDFRPDADGDMLDVSAMAAYLYAIEPTGSDTIITFDDDHTLTLVGFTDVLTADYFVIA